VAGGALALVIAANLAFARVQIAPSFYRTHVISRIWASIAVAAATAGVAAILGKRSRLAMLIPAVFVGFGIAGGIERQDFYLSSWRTHRSELRSVVEQVPGLRAGAQMILLMPKHPRFQALDVEYIGKSWLELVYDDASMESRTIFQTPRSLTACTPGERGFRCREESPGAATPGAGSAETTLPYSKAVLLAFSTRDGRFHLLDNLPAALMKGHSEWGSDYEPRLLVERGEIPSLGRHLLYGPDGFARFLDCPSGKRNARQWERFPVKVGDFDADGRPDILWRDNATGTNMLRFMNGTKIVRAVAVQPLTEPGWQLAGVGDFSRDGRADILWRNTKTGVTTVWFMDGATRHGWAYISGPPDVAWQLAGVGDFNGDGGADVLWRNTKTGVITVWFMSGATRGGWAYIPSPPDVAWQLAGVGDFNGDGKADILWRNTSTGVTTAWFMDGTKYTGWTYLQGLPDVAWRIEAVGDFDRDGKPDILWRHDGTQEMLVWFLNDTAFVRSDHVQAVPDLTN
jgi:hypothetical protein